VQEQTQDNSKLRDLLIGRIREKGRITFADFMAAALYEPGLGYYTSAGRKVGAEGDFYTSSNVHAVFGRLIAREVARMWEELGSPESYTVMEVGAGGGRLACDILDTLRDLAPECYKIVTYLFIEKEPSLREAQAELLAAHAPHLSWRSPQELAARSFSLTGCILSNELIDSFPVHLVQMTDTGLKEVFVEFDGTDFAEVLGDLSTPALEEYLRRLGIGLFANQRAEINLAAPAWLESAAGVLERGFVITIDYGYTATDLFSPMRRGGTLLCYRQHKVEENPYRNVGEQDITTHIDFSTLIERGEAFGLKTLWFGEQYRFLMATGLMEEMAALEASGKTEEERLKNRLALKKLILPDGGMGDTFKVLVQGKGVDKPSLLCLRDWGRLF
jgi:SAM-dependent MidA family methyltransferase